MGFEELFDTIRSWVVENWAVLAGLLAFLTAIGAGFKQIAVGAWAVFKFFYHPPKHEGSAASKDPVVAIPHVVEVEPQVTEYLSHRGPITYHAFTRNLEIKPDETSGEQTIHELRERLLKPGQKPPKSPQEITVSGTLLPIALLSMGWWDRRGWIDPSKYQWEDKVQLWLFHGFESWGPSWDFTWEFEHPEFAKAHAYFVAQLGEGDEANSVPVLVPRSMAEELRNEFLQGTLWRPLDVRITGNLVHRSQFRRLVGKKWADLVGGSLDYCLKIDQNAHDSITRLASAPSVYSGYLWRCVTTKEFAPQGKPLELSDVYFIWEHTNLANTDAIKYGLDALNFKESWLTKRLDQKLKLVAKSSMLVEGEPVWPPEAAYTFLISEQ